MNHEPPAPFEGLTPDCVIDAVEHQGLLSDARILALNSYENRVYQVGIEDDVPIIAKFYRPNRWQDDQIIEEHNYCLALKAADIPVVPPMEFDGETLLRYRGFRFALFQRRGGHAPELDNLDNLYTLGQTIGTIHAFSGDTGFNTRVSLSPARMGHESRRFLLEHDFLPQSTREAYESVSAHLLEKIDAAFADCSYRAIKLHGDCHPGNILWRDDKPHFVDLDDACSGPAIQDLWMLLSGDRSHRTQQLQAVIEGYEMFTHFEPSELRLLESLRSLRLMHYAAWLARRWHDPAFAIHFPWFNSERYWAEHVLELREQMAAQDEPPLPLLL